MGHTGCAQSYLCSSVFISEVSHQRIDSAEFEVSPVDQPDPFGFDFEDGNLAVLHLIAEGQGTADPETLRFEAAILPRRRSEVTSRSNWAKDRSTLRVSRPMEVVVLNCWVTETNDKPWASNSSTNFAKSANDRVRRSTL